ncbi:hypothetical protein BD626DRAFT_580421 [Schizophyllum amplum]|uniref:RING-type domain-containing protein n=1 Tax=Schizophyllum amplum TaxID=97359 RepID=A0A550CZS7_9AGAR|nr:hypothetical protein BD626DRAFT_580421 [Auriculariopsis ampla]
MTALALCTICLEARALAELRFFAACGHGFCILCLTRTTTDACPACRTPNIAGPPRRIYVDFLEDDDQELPGDATRPQCPHTPLHSDVTVDTSEDDLDTVVRQLGTLADAPRLDRETKTRVFQALATLEDELRPTLAALRAEREDNTLLLADLDAVYSALDGARNRVRVLEREREAVLKTQHVLERERRELQKERRSLVEIVARAMRELRASGKREKQYDEEVTALREERDVLQGQLSDQDLHVSFLERMLADKTAKAVRRGRRAAGLQKEVKALREDVVGLEHELQALGCETSAHVEATLAIYEDDETMVQLPSKLHRQCVLRRSKSEEPRLSSGGSSR